MKNTVLVNNSKTPGYVPFGFWYMSEENATSVKYLASHNNKCIEAVYEIGERFQVEMLQKFGFDGQPLVKDREVMTKWVFRLTSVGGSKEALAIKQLDSVNLYGVSGVVYGSIEL